MRTLLLALTTMTVNMHKEFRLNSHFPSPTLLRIIQAERVVGFGTPEKSNTGKGLPNLRIITDIIFQRVYLLLREFLLTLT